MASRSSSLAISRAERLLSHQQWRGGYVCARCMHTTRPQQQNSAPSSSRGRFTIGPRRERGARISKHLTDVANEKSTSSKQDEEPARARDRSSPATNPFEAKQYSDTVYPKPNAQQLIQSGQGTATIAGAEYLAVVRDRLRLALRPGAETPTFSHDSVKPIPVGPEISSVQGEETQKKPLENGASNGQNDEVQKKRLEKMRKANELYSRVLGESHVAGNYGVHRTLFTEPKKEKASLEAVERAMVMNPTYLARDQSRFIAKLASLMPAQAGPSGGARKASNKQAG